MIDAIGTWAPLLLFVLSIYVLWGKASYYVIGIIMNSVLNIFLKQIIHQPRPDSRERLKLETFGMPSGHAQSTAFSTVYIYLSTQTSLIYVYLFVTILCMIQRVAYNHHTFLQVYVGVLVGIMFAYVFYSLKPWFDRSVI